MQAAPEYATGHADLCVSMMDCQDICRLLCRFIRTSTEWFENFLRIFCCGSACCLIADASEHDRCADEFPLHEADLKSVTCLTLFADEEKEDTLMSLPVFLRHFNI